ncbi:MAG TPA: endonuclease III [Fimbriiglobus sp.]|jgi:endonuclease-3
MPSKKTPASRVPALLDALATAYPNAKCGLDFQSPLQLLIATILSAQCTDKRVNLVTPALFKKFPSAKAFAKANVEAIQSMIQSTGFFRNKARNIQACCKVLVENYDGEVPSTLEDLVALPGVGRKTANVVLGDAFHIPGITVDTHCGRLARRLGLTKQLDPVKVEHDLMTVLPRANWTRFSHQIIAHGRQVCHSRKPDCANCTLSELCPKIGVTATAKR